MKTELTAGRQRRTPPALLGYGVAVASVVAALGVAKWLQIQYGFEPFVPFICAMMGSAWFGGFKTGLVTLVLALLTFHYYFLIPIYPLGMEKEIPRLLIAALASLLIVWLCAAQRSATDSLRQTNESLRAEIAERKRTEALLEGQKRVLEMMAAGAPLSDSLAALTRLVEAQAPGMLGSILLLDEHGAQLRHGAAPSLPPEYVAAIDGRRIGPQAGSCGTAAYRKEPVFVEDIATDPRWEAYRAVAMPHGLRACWSTPIFDPQRQVLGTFAMYYRQPGLPQPEHLRLIEMATHIAAIAVCGHRAQAVLRESEAKLKEAQRLANIGYWERDLLADRITWSRETCRIWGLKTETAVLNQAKMQEMIHPDDRRLQSEALREVLEKGRKYDVEYRIVRPDGQVRFVHAWDEIERDESGRVIRIFGTVQDITERKQAELLLHAQAQEIRAIVENSPDLIIRFDRQLHRTFVNTAFIKGMGLPKEKLLGREIASAAKDGAVKATAEEIGTLEDSLQRAFDTKRPLDFESTWPLATGRRTFTVHLEPEFDVRGALTSILVISRDITERVRAEEALRGSEQRLRTILRTAMDGFWRADEQGRLLEVNAAYCRMSGYSEDELLTMSISDLEVLETPVEFAAHARKIMERGEDRFETQHRRKDGSSFLVEVSAQYIALKGGNLVAFLRDITERKQLELALRKSENDLAEAQRLARIGSWSFNVDTHEISWSDELYRIFGLEKSKFGGTHEAFLACVHPEDRERALQCNRECYANARPFDVEYRIVTPAGETKVIHEIGSPLLDEAGKVKALVGTAQDVTQRKEAETKLHASRERLRALTARLESMREEERIRISREIHDDLGQKLTGLKMDLLRAERKIEQLESSELVNSLLDTIVSATELVDGITASVQEIAANLRPGVLDKLGLAAALQYESRRFQERTGVLVEARLPKTEPILPNEVSTTLFRIFQECLTNVARHAGATKVEAELKVEPGVVKVETDLAILSLRDNGKGIKEADMANPQSLGVLGIKERAALLGGEVVLQAHPGQGTNVTVRIPMTGMTPATGNQI
jgi:PAS domain S-box-containing protein